MFMKYLLAALSFLALTAGGGDPVASPHAARGGQITAYAGPWPQSFNYYLNNNVFSATVFSFMYESLLGLDPVTAEYAPGLAEKWEISGDKRTFTFWIDPRAKWSDGKPVTAQDVAWTFSAVMDPKNLTGVHKVSLETIKPPVVVSERCIRFTTDDIHWRNLGAVGGFSILPKHAFATQDFNKINFAFPVISGPYRLSGVRDGVRADFTLREDWWAREKPENRHVANFKTIAFRFYEEHENAFEAFKKGMIDIFPVYTARLWVNETGDERFLKNWIIKQKIENYRPIGFQGFAMNMRRPPFDDVRVRRAMAHLLNRPRMNETLMYNQYFLHRSYFEDLYSSDIPCPNEFFDFSREKAIALLNEAGWKMNTEKGLLEKNGQPFIFSFLSRDASTEKFLNIYAEDLKAVGIEMKIDRKDWAAWTKDMDEFNFQMTWASWSAGIFKDPEGMWASKEAEREGGNNITGFKNDRVDELIEKQKTEFDIEVRNDICREIDRIAAAEVPYVLLWNINCVRLLYWNKFGTPPTVLSKFGDDSSAFSYWWFDPDSAADLAEAMKNEDHLPPAPPVVNFDRSFRGGSEKDGIQ